MAVSPVWNQAKSLSVRFGTVGPQTPRMTVMVGFESTAARNETIKNYQALLERAERLSEPYITKIACDYSAKGRFRKYLENDIKEVRQVGLDNGPKSLFLRSLSDLKADK